MEAKLGHGHPDWWPDSLGTSLSFRLPDLDLLSRKNGASEEECCKDTRQMCNVLALALRGISVALLSSVTAETLHTFHTPKGSLGGQMRLGKDDRGLCRANSIVRVSVPLLITYNGYTDTVTRGLDEGCPGLA